MSFVIGPQFLFFFCNPSSTCSRWLQWFLVTPVHLEAQQSATAISAATNGSRSDLLALLHCEVDELVKTKEDKGNVTELQESSLKELE